MVASTYTSCTELPENKVASAAWLLIFCELRPNVTVPPPVAFTTTVFPALALAGKVIVTALELFTII